MKYHTDLTTERWFKFSLMEQLANVGSDVFRTISWKNKGNIEFSQQAFLRALELLDLTIADPKHKKKPCKKELMRAREALIDYFMYDNVYKSTDKLWENYFYGFNYLAALERGR